MALGGRCRLLGDAGAVVMGAWSKRLWRGDGGRGHKELLNHPLVLVHGHVVHRAWWKREAGRGRACDGGIACVGISLRHLSRGGAGGEEGLCELGLEASEQGQWQGR